VLKDFEDDETRLESECEFCEPLLKYTTYIGNSLSMIGLAATIIIYICDLIK
jgi:hypothetical protein